MDTILNLSDCARRVGISRVTIGRHIKSGKVSVVKDRKGKKGIHISELLRVYGELQHDTGSDAPSKTVTSDDTDSHARCDELIHELKHRVQKLEESEDYLKRMLEQSFLRIEGKSEKKKKGKKGKKKGKK
jgi:hypothetical protein